MTSPTIYLPISSGGTADPDAVRCAREEIKRGIRRVILAAHGWQTTATAFMADVDLMTTGLEPYLDLDRVLVLPIHWKSCIDDDAESPAQAFDLLTFMQMRDRADMVGAGAVYTLCDAMTDDAGDEPLEFSFIGHSFGTRVACSCIQQFASRNQAIPPTFRTLLLQGAFNADALEPGQPYGNVHKLANSRLFVTHSPLDRALNLSYYAVSGFHKAIGAVGPTDLTKQVFGDILASVDIGPIQAQYPGANMGIAGSHSNLYLDPLYQLMADFIKAV